MFDSQSSFRCASGRCEVVKRHLVRRKAIISISSIMQAPKNRPVFRGISTARSVGSWQWTRGGGLQRRHCSKDASVRMNLGVVGKQSRQSVFVRQRTCRLYKVVISPFPQKVRWRQRFVIWWAAEQSKFESSLVVPSPLREVQSPIDPWSEPCFRNRIGLIKPETSGRH